MLPADAQPAIRRAPLGIHEERIPRVRVRPAWFADGPTIGLPRPPAVVETDIPARLDRLPWSRFHTLVVAALGITWILDGLEVTLAGSVAGALKASPVLQFSNADVGLAASAYLGGAVLGALFFGWLTDRLGRKKLFFITLAVYLCPPPRRPRCRGISGASRCFAFSPARASAANMPRSTRPSRS